MKRTTMKTNYVHHITQPLAVSIYTMKDCNLRLPSPLKKSKQYKNQNQNTTTLIIVLKMKKSPPIKRMLLENMNAKQENSQIHEITYISPRFLSFY